MYEYGVRGFGVDGLGTPGMGSLQIYIMLRLAKDP